MQKFQPNKKINVYLDTNILLNLREIPFSDILNLFCSQLSIVELIAGMATEREYRARRHALIKIKERQINIIWQSPKTLLTKAFGIPHIDHDVLATMIMMQRIIETEEFSEAGSIYFHLGGNKYTIEKFANHDKETSEESSELLKGLLNLRKELIEEAKNIEINPQIIDNWSDMTASSFLNRIGYKEKGFQYIIYWNNYKSFKSMKNGISFLMIYNILAIIHHNIPGRNDGIDLAHLSYTDDMDLFISNDKIFRKFKKYSNLEMLSLKEFLDSINKPNNTPTTFRGCDRVKLQ